MSRVTWWSMHDEAVTLSMLAASFGCIRNITGRFFYFLQIQQKVEHLAIHFITLMKDINKLFDILDVRVKECYQDEEVIFVADIPKRCLNLNGKSRP